MKLQLASTPIEPTSEAVRARALFRSRRRMLGLASPRGSGCAAYARYAPGRGRRALGESAVIPKVCAVDRVGRASHAGREQGSVACLGARAGQRATPRDASDRAGTVIGARAAR